MPTNRVVMKTKTKGNVEDRLHYKITLKYYYAFNQSRIPSLFRA